MLPTALPVLWKDGDRSGINGVVQVHQSDLQFRDAKIRDLVAVLNTKIPKPSGSSRAVQSVLLYGARLSSDRRLDAIVPDLAGSSPRLMATMGSPPSTTLDVVIVVDTLTGKMTRVPFNPKVSVADVKQRLQDMEGIPQNDQIFVVNNARLEDNRALESYNIHNGSLIYLVWKLKRGYISPRSVGGGLDDVVQANHETTAASRWRIAYEGLNVEGRCTNEYCAAFQRMVIRPYQFESFNLVREGSILCPVCHCPVKPLTCGFLNCAWKFDGIRAGNGLSISSPWRDASGTSFTDTQDKRLVVLALEYESQSKRVVWKEVARAMRGKHSTQALENRLRVLKRTYGRDLARFPRCFFSTASPQTTNFHLLAPRQAERTVRNVFSGVSAFDVRQQAGKTDENAGELLPAAVSSVIQMIGNVQQDDVFLDVGAGLGNVAAQFAIQTNARQCLGIEKQPELVSRGIFCLRTRASRTLLLHKVILHQGNVLDTPLSTTLPFQDASVIYLNDFLFDETAKLVVQQELSLIRRARLIISTSRYCPRHRESCRRRFCAKWELTETTYGHASWKSLPVPIYMYKMRQ
ncbi:hypothetical protein PR001_g24853 [Phytophthora rubi]|uniref:Histone-lysine N-methyltransferase, H3 lysine-79 specific n=1 Tax=Phytophthora rubi TaxID=129364 RepID=A0A6A3I992_9STRA|nr:hypothetical protein PR001_g24853 [Phytophthora rubi]